MSDDQTTVESGAEGAAATPGSNKHLISGTITREAPRKRRSRTASQTGDDRLVYEPGQPFGERYTIIDRLGQGGMGVVYKARDLELNRTVALKMIRADPAKNPSAIKRFKRELELSQEVSHPNVCRVHDLGEADGVRFLSMEYLEGHTLRQLVREVGGLSVRQTLQFADQICAALEAIHEKGIVHRDLKPSNIGIDYEGHAVVMDFGIARRPQDWEVTKPGMMVGSYAYLAPEQMRGEEIDHRVDIYALGLLLFEMLTGKRPPGDGDSRPLALRGEDAKCPRLIELEPDVPRPLDSVVRSCLSWEREDRPADASAVRSSLQEIRDEFSREQVVPAWRQRRRRRSMVLVGAAALALIALGLLAVPAVQDRLTGLLGGVDPADITISVLPFESPDDDPEAEILAAVVSDAVFGGLQSVPDLRVPPLDSAELELGGHTVGELATAVDVDYLVRGAVTDRGQSVEMVLISADGREVWSRSWPGGGSTRFEELDDAIRRLLTRGLRLERGVQGTPVIELRTDTLEAYERYIAGWLAHGGWRFAGDLDLAQHEYANAVNLDGSFGAAMAAQVIVMSRKRRLGASSLEGVERVLADRAHELAPDLPETWMARAVVAINDEQWDEAAADLTRLAELAPGNDAALDLAYDFYLSMQRHAEARAMLEAMVSVRPEYWRSRFLLGSHLAQYTEESEAAGEHLRLASELEPEWMESLVLIVTRGYYHMIRAELGEAQKFFDLAIRIEPAWGYEKGLILYYLGDFDGARDVWEAALEARPTEPDIHAGLADAYRQLGRADEAQNHYRRALQVYDKRLAASPPEEDWTIKAHRLPALAGLGRCDDALADSSEILALYPESAEYAYNAAQVAALCGKSDRAIELVLQSLPGKNLVGILYDPDFAFARRNEQVRETLELLGHRLPPQP